jgi:putative phosphoesterase
VLAVVLSDTHLAAGRFDRLPRGAVGWLERADVVLHAGDIVAPDVLGELRSFAPVHAVLGNNDHQLARLLDETVVVELDGVPVGMIHNSGPKAGRAARLKARFPNADIVVFGHSHLPVVQVGIDGQLLFNPGSPTQRRMAPAHTIGVLEVVAGSIARAEIVDV